LINSSFIFNLCPVIKSLGTIPDSLILISGTSIVLISPNSQVKTLLVSLPGSVVILGPVVARSG